MPEEVKKNAAEQAAQAQKQPVPMPTTYEALRHDLIASGRAYDFDMIDRAYQLASAAHATQFRRSGEPYICHPISVAQLLVELGMDSESVAAALMHDVAEDTPVTIDEIRQKFGSEVALLVDGVTKLTQIKFSNVEDRKAENLRKMLLAMSQDVRVMIIKLPTACTTCVPAMPGRSRNAAIKPWKPWRFMPPLPTALAFPTSRRSWRTAACNTWILWAIT